MSEGGTSARARLIKTRRGTWVDRSLFPAARQECREILLKVADEVEGTGIAKLFRGERERLGDYPISEYLRSMSTYAGPWECWGSERLAWAGLQAFEDEIGMHRAPEERNASYLAMIAAYKPGRMCGSCGRELQGHEPLWFGARVYVGMRPFLYKVRGSRVGVAEYRRTVLCRRCAPDRLSPEREGVVTQLCAYCERPMIYLLSLESLRRTLCSDECRDAFTNQTRRESRAGEREKVCEVCGQGFTATRKDSKTCSKKCKQAAYRRRKREVDKNR